MLRAGEASVVAAPPRFDACIAGIGTALPPYIVPQAIVAEHVIDSLSDPRLRKFARRLFRRSGVEARPFVIPDALDASLSSLYKDGEPSLGQRMAVYREEAPTLAETAARRALADARVEPSAVTHLVLVTSTGSYTPGPDVDLVDRLGLSPTVERTVVSMMGCSGAFNGIRVARRGIEAHSEGVALLVCVELCSIHMDRDCDPGRIVAYTLFGDAAAAVVLQSGTPVRDAWAVLREDASRLETQHRAVLEWKLGDRGFELHLGRSLPEAVAASVGGFVAPLVRHATGSADPGRIAWWAVHPGGTAILRKVEESLGLKPEALAASRDVFCSLGNLSSPSVIFVLERELSRAPEGGSGILLGFGPGLALEAIHAVRGGRESR
jgi:predicted naringenin-chalcone synthase